MKCSKIVKSTSREIREEKENESSLGIGSVELEDNEIRLVGKMVLRAEGKVRRVHLPGGSVGELRSRVREDIVPPREELGRVALDGDRIVSCSVACRDWGGKRTKMDRGESALLSSGR